MCSNLETLYIEGGLKHTRSKIRVKQFGYSKYSELGGILATRPRVFWVPKGGNNITAVWKRSWGYAQLENRDESKRDRDF